MARELVYTGFMSLDGVADSPGTPQEGHPAGGWVLRTAADPESFSLKGEELEETSALLLGRSSYEMFAPIWRDSADHAEYRDLPKYVVSTTLAEEDLFDGWGPTTILRSIADVAALRQEDGGALFVHGSTRLTRSLAEAGLIDRYNLLLFPLLLGEGKSLFSRSGQGETRLRLRESASYANGVVKLVYEVER